MTTDAVYRLMERAGELPYGEARTVLVEDALRHAEASGDEVLSFHVRMELTTAYQYGGEPIKTFGTFSRCLADHDRDPGRYGEDAERRLLWHFKAVVNSLTKFPEVPLDRTYAVLDDMERRYRMGGHSMHAVYARRESVAQHLGDTEGADHWYAKWHGAARDELSDCEGCDPNSKLVHLAWRGRDEDALEIAAPVLREELRCSEQPQHILTGLLLVYLRTGRLDAARDAHRRAYRIMRANLSDLGSLGDHLEFCARTGNEARGLEIVERHLGPLDRAPSPNAAMRFAAGAALVLRRVRDAGHGDVLLRRPPHGERTATEISVAALHAELAAQATDLAAAFDARNGTGHQGDLVRAVLDAEPVTDGLPLTPHSRGPAWAAATESPADAASPPAGPLDPVELLGAAEGHWARGEIAAAYAAWQRFDEVAGPAADLPVAIAGRRTDGHGFESIMDDDPEGAVAAWRRAAELHAEAGDEERRQSALSRVGAVLCRIDRAEEGIALLEAAAGWAAAQGPGAGRRVAIRVRLAAAQAHLGRPQDALATLDATIASDPADVASVEEERAKVLAGFDGRRAEAVAASLRARDGYREAGRARSLAEAALLYGRLLAEPAEQTAGAAAAEDADHAEAVSNAVGEAFTEAVVTAPADAPFVRASAHVTRGTWLLSRDRVAEAVEDLIEAVAGFTAVGAFPQAAYARQDLCVGYHHAGRYLEAAEAAEEAIAMLTRLGDLDAVNRSRWMLAGIQRELGELEEAAENFTVLADAVSAGQPDAAAEFYESAGELLGRLDKDGIAAERFAAAAELHLSVGAPFGVVRARRQRALCLLWSRRPEEALKEMDTARQALADLPGDEPDAVTWETALVGYDEARLLSAVGRRADALARADEAVAGFTALGNTDAAEAATRLRAGLLEPAAE
jgi:tetratricopeptide (TPR) repeat protein